jgi:hypothetical protein
MQLELSCFTIFKSIQKNILKNYNGLITINIQSPDPSI